jgi:Lrp/AsnC family transcriptional regulator, leucine-responsive regulatory protein
MQDCFVIGVEMDAELTKSRTSVSMKGLDRFDLRILEILQNDNKTSQRAIGDQVNLSAPAVQRRIKSMEEAGVITANVAVVDPTSVGQSITIVVEVNVESERIDLLDAAKASFSAAPEVQQCYYVTGESDFILVVTVPTMSHYESLTRRIFFENGNIKRFRTLVVMDRVKATLGVPIHAD